MSSFMSKILCNIEPITFSILKEFATGKVLDSSLYVTLHTFAAQSSKISKKSNSVLFLR